MPCTDSTTRGLPSAPLDVRPSNPVDGADPITAAVCEHLLGACFAVPSERLIRTEESPR